MGAEYILCILLKDDFALLSAHFSDHEAACLLAVIRIIAVCKILMVVVKLMLWDAVLRQPVRHPGASWTARP